MLLISDRTTGAILDENFCFIANTRICNLEDDNVVDLNKLESVHIAVVSLR
jgi:hypothetical protein